MKNIMENGAFALLELALHARVIIHAFVVVVCLLFKISFSANYFSITISVKQFGSRSGPTFCQSDLGPNCLQVISRQH